MSIKTDILFKDSLQISETCTLLDMSRQNLYKLRKDGRINRLVESTKNNNQFTKDSVYQEWFQRHIKTLNIQVPLQPMKTLTQIPIHQSETPFEMKYIRPMLNVLLSNYGTTKLSIQIPHEYTLRLYHILCNYVLDLVKAFQHDIKKNTQIDTSIYAWIENLSFERDMDEPFYEYIREFKAQCGHENSTLTMIQNFIKSTDIYNEEMIFSKTMEDFLENYVSLREDLIFTIVDIAKLLRIDIAIYDDTGELKERLKALHAVNHTPYELSKLINQILIILYDAK